MSHNYNLNSWLAQREEIDRLRAENEALATDALRYRWLRDAKPCSLSITLNDGHACNYMNLSEFIESCDYQWYADVPADELQKMKETNTDWCIQIYPNTPVGFNLWHAATLDTAIDAAMEAK